MEDFKKAAHTRIINRVEGRFGIVPDYITNFAGEVGVHGVAVFAVLCIHVHKTDRQCYPSVPTIARCAGLGITSTKKALELLIKHGLVRKIFQGNGRGKSSLYEIPSDVRKGSQYDGFTEKGSQYDNKGVAESPERGRITATNSIRNIYLTEEEKGSQYDRFTETDQKQGVEAMREAARARGLVL